MAAQRYDAQAVMRMSPEDALNELRKQGINSLEDLVNKSMEQLRTAGTNTAALEQVEDETFIYRCFVYTCKRDPLK